MKYMSLLKVSKEKLKNRIYERNVQHFTFNNFLVRIFLKAISLKYLSYRSISWDSNSLVHSLPQVFVIIKCCVCRGNLWKSNINHILENMRNHSRKFSILLCFPVSLILWYVFYFSPKSKSTFHFCTIHIPLCLFENIKVSIQNHFIVKPNSIEIHKSKRFNENQNNKIEIFHIC